MKTRTMWAWLNRGGHVMSVHSQQCYAMRDAINNGGLTRDVAHLDPKERWRRLRKDGHKVMKVWVCAHYAEDHNG